MVLKVKHNKNYRQKEEDFVVESVHFDTSENHEDEFSRDTEEVKSVNLTVNVKEYIDVRVIG